MYEGICLYVYNEPIGIDVYVANFSQNGLLLAEACEWISKLLIVILTLCKMQHIVSFIRKLQGIIMVDLEGVGAN